MRLWPLLMIVVVLAVILSFGFYFDTQNGALILSINPFSKAIANAVRAKYYDMAQAAAVGYVQPEDILSIICRETGSYVLAGKDSSQIAGDNGNSIGIMQIDLLYHPEYTKAELQDDVQNIQAGTQDLSDCFNRQNGNRQAAYGCYNGSGEGGDYAITCMDYYNYFLNGSVPNA